MKITALMGLIALLAILAFFGNTSGDYVGSEKCGDCHEGQYDSWRETMHGTDFATEWMRGGVQMNKYTYNSADPDNGTFGGCGSCHVVGEGDTENGGTIMTEPWNSTHNLPLGSIGCENCHGPGSGHVDDRSGNPEYMQANEFTYSLSCAGWSTVSNTDRPGVNGAATCHDGYRMGGIPADEVPGYYDSVHAGGIGSSSPKGNPECYHCMAAQGFIDVTIGGEDPPEEDDFSEVDGQYFVDGELIVYGIYCGVCHDPHEHSEDTHFQLRAPEEEICELCHYNTHVFPDTHVRHGTSEFRHGLNGKDVPVITYMDEVSCPECHMWASAGHGDPPVKVGHSFEWAPQACVACHSMYTNDTAEEYVDAIHSQYEDLVAAFGDAESGLLFEVEERHAWAMANDLWTEEVNMTFLKAEWNYAYPTQDGSRGAHNPEYMRAMLESAMEKFEMVLDDTNIGGVGGTVKWAKGDAIEGAKIMDGHGATVATTDADGAYFFWTDAGGTRTFIVEDANGKTIGSISAEVTVMQNVTKDVEFEKATGGDGDGDGDDEETDTMTYVFIGIIIVLIIILIVMAMMGNKGAEE